MLSTYSHNYLTKNSIIIIITAVISECGSSNLHECDVLTTFCKDLVFDVIVVQSCSIDDWLSLFSIT